MAARLPLPVPRAPLSAAPGRLPLGLPVPRRPVAPPVPPLPSHAAMAAAVAALAALPHPSGAGRWVAGWCAAWGVSPRDGFAAWSSAAGGLSPSALVALRVWCAGAVACAAALAPPRR